MPFKQPVSIVWNPLLEHTPDTASKVGRSLKGLTMNRRVRFFGFLVSYFFAVVLFFAKSVSAQEAAPFIEDARKYVIESVKDRTKLTLDEKSLMNWTNPARQQERGAVYVWTLDERPVAIGSLFTYEYNEKVYAKHEFQSLSAGPLLSKFDGKLTWAPKAAGIEWRDFEDSPKPGPTHTARLLLMRQLARPFRAELISPKEDKTELRLISRPLIEYSSPKNGVIDGAIFSFAVATDPEVLLLIEAYESDVNGVKRTGFRRAFARFHYWKLSVYDGDQKVWEAPLDTSHESNPIGDKKNIEKTYNSYHPRDGAEK